VAPIAIALFIFTPGVKECGRARAPRDQKHEVRERCLLFFYILYFMLMLYGKASVIFVLY